MDSALTKFANEQYRAGELASEGEKLRAAWEAANPEYSKHGDQKLPYFRRSLKGWGRLAPSRGRLAPPEEAVDLVTGSLLSRGRKDQQLTVRPS